MIDTLENGHHALYHHAKFGEIKLRAPARCENMAFLFVTLGLPARGGHILNKCCVTVYGSILMVFSLFFGRDYCPLRCARKFLLSSLGGATTFVKLRSKIVKSPKIAEKVCAPHFVDI